MSRISSFVNQDANSPTWENVVAGQQISCGCEIVCERGRARVPLLTANVNLVVLGNGALPLHAAAFRFDGTGVLVTGWSKGGKTETLLAFMASTRGSSAAAR